LTYQIITYSGTTCNNYLYFAFDGDFFDTEIITKELGIEPTSVMVKKDPVPKKTSWKYKIEVGKDIVLEPYIERLIDIFESKIADINRIKENFKLETRLIFVLDIDINPDSPTPAFPLNKRVIDFLGRTKTSVDFDLYKADTIGLLNKWNN